MERNQYLEMFIDESTEHLQAVNDNLMKLEQNPGDTAIVDEVFRSAHTLKGMAATMGYEDLASLTHQMENVLDGIRNDKIEADSGVMDVVFASVDDLEAMVTDIASGGEGRRDVSAIVNRLEHVEKGTAPAEEKTSGAIIPESRALTYDDFERTVIQQAGEQDFNAYSVKISLSPDVILKAARVYMVFEVLEQAGEVVKSVPSVEELEDEQFELDFTIVLITKETQEDIQQRILKVSEVKTAEVKTVQIDEKPEEMKEEKNQFEEEAALPAEQGVRSPEPVSEASQKPVEKSTESSAAPQSKTIRVNIDRLDSLMNLFEELVIDRGRLEQISKELESSELTDTVEHMSRISGDLQSIILTMRMVPVEQVFNRFPRMVRSLSKELEKKVSLDIIGAETELDRTVIDEIGDPLVHLLRNSIDHGIEIPEKRRNAGKPETGHITLKAYHSGNHVFIEVSDDGGGINRDKVLQKALKSGVVSPENAAQLSDRQVYELLFSSGLSTADEISDISGRGVGLDVVKNKIESLGGTVSVDSSAGEGTHFLIQLPLTLSIISVMLVEVQDEVYAVPLSSIIETAIIKKDDIMAAHNQKVIDFRGSVVPLIDLTSFFDVPVTREENDYYSVVIVRKGEKMAALVVNSFIGQQEIVLKSLGDYLQNIFAISGATILGNGKVALILDCNALIK
ncbi:chemotaxis protein CheA [Alkalicoccus urumqiensis]|uniref:Chemotaxis protein CheA n=1 Tax=Alkalicoccus urumqiensis TaxID=1548213 RepID=A0A2P6MG47_ALKUR|nr:chemotaxis protein CheA [Alkalicoccus urumqiensis]PRO65210.1 chemotaxis protein CheA [Alkalicoccus urumqiensis]